MSECIAELQADLKVAQSRAEAYRQTCTVQGGKLLEIQVVLKTYYAQEYGIQDCELPIMGKLRDGYLETIRQILQRKG